MDADARLTVEPTSAQIELWADTLVPEPELWYADDSLIGLADDDCTVFVYAELPDDHLIRTIRYANAYEQWRRPKDRVTHGILSDPGWIMRLDPDDRRRVIAFQADADRGLRYPITHVDRLPEACAEFVVDDRIVICHTSWAMFSAAEQHEAIRRELPIWDDEDCLPIPADAPDHIRAVANAFLDDDGTNCLSTTAYAITGDTNQLHQWMHPFPFHALLDALDYRERAPEPPQRGDILTFSVDGDTVHAAYALGSDRFLNKSGQCRFNPIRVVNRAMLDADWSDTTPTLWRSDEDHKHADSDHSPAGHPAD